MKAQNANHLPDTKHQSHRSFQLRKALSIIFTTSFTVFLLALFLSPFAFMVSTSLKTQAQRTILGGPIWPAVPVTIQYNGKPAGCVQGARKYL